MGILAYSGPIRSPGVQPVRPGMRRPLLLALGGVLAGSLLHPCLTRVLWQTSSVWVPSFARGLLLCRADHRTPNASLCILSLSVATGRISPGLSLFTHLLLPKSHPPSAPSLPFPPLPLPPPFSELRHTASHAYVVSSIPQRRGGGRQRAREARSHCDGH